MAVHFYLMHIPKFHKVDPIDGIKTALAFGPSERPKSPRDARMGMQ